MWSRIQFWKSYVSKVSGAMIRAASRQTRMSARRTETTLTAVQLRFKTRVGSSRMELISGRYRVDTGRGGSYQMISSRRGNPPRGRILGNAHVPLNWPLRSSMPRIASGVSRAFRGATLDTLHQPLKLGMHLLEAALRGLSLRNGSIRESVRMILLHEPSIFASRVGDRQTRSIRQARCEIAIRGWK